MLRKEPDPDSELGKLPILLFEAFNAGDLQYIRDKINENLTLTATLKTMMIENPLIGRHNCYNFLHALSVSHPDMVFVLKNVRLTGKHGEGGGRCVKFKYYFTGIFYRFIFIASTLLNLYSLSFLTIFPFS
jgi:hypothetical protein